VEVVDIGLDVSGARAQLVQDPDVGALLPRRPRDAHKWQTAVFVVAGSPGMMGAARLCSEAAARAGAGMVRLGVPGAEPRDLPASEVVARPLPAAGWAPVVLEELARCRALVVGPGLGRGGPAREGVRRLVAEAPVPVVIDADGLTAMGPAGEAASVIAGRKATTVLTPHDGEFSQMAGAPPGPDRLAAARMLARVTGATVLLKGSTTVVSSPEGGVLLSANGSPGLASAGTGDVLSGVIGAFLASGVGDALAAAGLAAHAHAGAACLGPPLGLVAGDLLQLLPRWLSAAVSAFGDARG
jgi:NAD(P)H-hydrate epimerase